MKNSRWVYFYRWLALSAFLLAVMFMPGCATQQYNIRVESEGGVPESGALVVVRDWTKLSAKGLVLMAWGNIRSVFTGEDAADWLRRSTEFPTTTVEISNQDGVARIKMARTNVIIYAIDSDLTHIWDDTHQIKRRSRKVDYVLTSYEMSPATNRRRKVVLGFLNHALKSEENQRPEIIEYKNRLEKLLEEQPPDAK